MARDAAGDAVLSDAVAAARGRLGARLVAAYALGSLAHGGFDPLVSDVDVALVLADPPQPGDAAAVEAIAARVRSAGTPLHERLSLFWGTLASLEGVTAPGRLPPVDRLDLADNGRLLHGHDVRERVARPAAHELLVSGAEFALGYLGGERALEQVRRPELLLAAGPRPLTRAVLLPVRLRFTAATGRVAGSDAAAGHHLADPGAPAKELVAAALAWRGGRPPGAGAAALLRRELALLQLHFVEDAAGRLAAAGAHELAQRFERWAAVLRP